MEKQEIIEELETIEMYLNMQMIEETFVTSKTLYNILQAEKPVTVNLMKSVHIANNFRNDFLKQTSYLLDEIEQYLSKSKVIKKNQVNTIANEELLKRIEKEKDFTTSPTYEKESVTIQIESLLKALGK